MKKNIVRIITSATAVAIVATAAIPFVSAATMLDKSKTNELSLSCTKPGYTFEVFEVASLESNAESPYETSYKSLVPEISASIKAGDTKTALSTLDGLSSMPTTAKSQGTWTTSEASYSKTFTGLEHGIYYIKATNFPAGVKSVSNSIVSLPYYDSDSKAWIYSYGPIDLASKVVDDTPTTHKSITNSTKKNTNFTDVSLGDTVNFEIRSTTAGSDSMHLKTYAVYDEMSAGLTLNKSSFAVSLLKEDGTKIKTLDKSSYTVNVTSESAGKSTEFNVALTSAYLDTADFYTSGAAFTSITYSAKLNKYAIVGKDGNPNTEDRLEFSNKNGVKSEVKGNDVYVYSFAIGTTKTDEDNKALKGAEFRIFKTESEARDWENSTAIATGTSDSDGKVKYIKTNTQDEMKFKSGTYYAVETKAPEGFNLYPDVITVDIDVQYGSNFVNGSYITNQPKDGKAEFTVKDNSLVLPQTGGNVSSLYLIGFVLIGASTVLFFSAKVRKNSSK